VLLRLRTKPGTARHWSDFVKPRRRPHSPNSARLKCPWEGPRFRNKTRTAKWPKLASNYSTGCMWMEVAELFSLMVVAHPPNSCSTTRIDPRDRLGQLDRRDQWGRLRRLPPFRLVQLHLDHPAHLLVPADLQDPPPNWNSSKWFYLLNIQNTWTMPMPFAKYICGSVIYSRAIIIRIFIHIDGVGGHAGAKCPTQVV
jgi:hypothetical protein